MQVVTQSQRQASMLSNKGSAPRFPQGLSSALSENSTRQRKLLFIPLPTLTPTILSHLLPTALSTTCSPHEGTDTKQPQHISECLL